MNAEANFSTGGVDSRASDSEASTGLFSDYHLHPQGHRLQPYTQELLQPWADHARQIGLRDIALTDHDRYHASVDFGEIDRLRAANPDLKIRAGIELDNDPVHSAAGRAWVEKNWDRLDFVLGSVHFLDVATGLSITLARKPSLPAVTSTKFTPIITRASATMAGSGLVDCMAHLDLVKIFGFRPTNDLSDLLDTVLSEIKRADLAMELSTAGWRKPVGELYPSDEIIRGAQAKGIPFTTASDGIPTSSRAKTSRAWPKRWPRSESRRSSSSTGTNARSLGFSLVVPLRRSRARRPSCRSGRKGAFPSSED